MFREVEAAQSPRPLDDVGAAIVNNDYVREAGLDFEEDSILLEAFDDNPYVNVLVARADDVDDPRITTLVELLTSPETAAFIEEEFGGSVIPAARGRPPPSDGRPPRVGTGGRRRSPVGRAVAKPRLV
ncbi:MetQ/NlpA family ABC transporter substrate-binding protein [Nocardiopsis sp. N85]|uniref:MetQ/NlpA family ABC transporter substrate-binding protein n=1 Tax=Nocardiopsis sp. N85 TaxID=3029400 RepID=UPI00237FA384|nr:MetQ/NlpA family ABC transporter substrate-binding protein [Nocardiopsis sp. N85]MDE3721999.1 MetQ/NlpA family ABC transporter substrate-binding protein [Nocardiopsis sp. N85]